jgi:segregation and condensation protein B
MPDPATIPELRQIIGALLFGSRHPLGVPEIRRVLKQTAEGATGPVADFGEVGKADIERAIQELKQTLAAAKVGFNIVEVANGYRLANDGSCGGWLRSLLDKGRPARLSQPALETLAIVAYRQPCTRSEIEAIRGVAVDQMVRTLLEMQLLRLAGRSELPGRPWLLGTTQKFLEHFGLRSLDDLPGVDELKRMEAERVQKADPAPPEPSGPGHAEADLFDEDDIDDEEDDDDIDDEEDEDEDDDEPVAGN